MPTAKNRSEPELLAHDGLNLKILKGKKISELAQIGKGFNVDGAANMRRQDLIFAILQAQTEKNGFIYGEGVFGDTSGWFWVLEGSGL